MNYNDSKKACELIERVAKMNYFGIIVVVDNNSNNDEKEFLKNNISPVAKVIYSEENKGFACGNNIGLRYISQFTECEYVLICNTDIIFELDGVKKCYEVMKQNKDIAASTVLRKEFDGKEVDCFWNFRSKKYLLDQMLVLKGNKLRKTYKSIKKENGFYVDCIRGSFLFSNMKCLKEIDFFDENTFLYYEEDILFSKLKRIGYRAYVIPEYFYIHNHPSQKGKINIKIIKANYKSLYYFLKEYIGLHFWDKIHFKINYFIAIFEYNLLNIKR